MNYLAHIYLSGEDTLLKIGNFMADSVRGKNYLNYPIPIQKGILLHRFIDSFTDNHSIYRQSKHRLHNKYGHFSGVIMDIFYDHFLAKNWEKYHSSSLEIYVDNFYKSLHNNYELLTDKTKNILPYMILDNWLLSYKTIDGLEKILIQMNHRTKNAVRMNESIVELKKYYSEFEAEFSEFFIDLKFNCQAKIDSL